MHGLWTRGWVRLSSYALLALLNLGGDTRARCARCGGGNFGVASSNSRAGRSGDFGGDRWGSGAREWLNSRAGRSFGNRFNGARRRRMRGGSTRHHNIHKLAMRTSMSSLNGD